MTVMGRLLFALVLVVALGVAPGGGSSAAAEAVHHPHVAGTGFVYDSPAASTTPSANARAAASRGYDVSRNISWAHTRFSDRDLATKAGRSADNLPPIRGGAPGAGGRASKLSPNDDALGPHTVFRRGQDGRIDKYTRFDDFGNETLRFRGSGGSHAGLDPPLFYGAKPGKGPGAPLNRARNPGPDDYQNLPPGY